MIISVTRSSHELGRGEKSTARRRQGYRSAGRYPGTRFPTIAFSLWFNTGSPRSRSDQGIQHREGGYEIRRGEAFGVSFMNRRERVAGLVAPARPLPEAGKAHRGS
jgi:hypothetical protein